MSDSEVVSTRRLRIAQLAREAPERGLTSLAHYLDLAWMRQAYRLTRKDGAVGVDGQTAKDYAANLDQNLLALLEKAKSGQYHAPSVRRVYIPKGSSGATRPIGIPTFEDKLLQRAVAMVLESVYEQDFLDCSYGFRPNRGAIMAVERVQTATMELRGGTVIELDIRSFFDTLSHDHLREFVGKRIRDGVLLRLIGKWLNAGVFDRGAVTHPEAGTPQGGVISPLLANVYLHYVLDLWFEQEVKPRLWGKAELVRYADDAVIVCERAEDARRVLAVLPHRFGRFGLTLHPDKTRMVTFNRPPLRRDDDKDPPASPGSFDFLGFTLHWGKSRRGKSVVRLRTAKDRLARSIRAVLKWCRFHRHLSLAEQHHDLSQKMKGHYGYYGVIGNSLQLQRFSYNVGKAWHYWLARRSGKAKSSWAWFNAMLKRYPLPPPRIVHSAYGRA